jgi:hypothetical protein
MQKEAFMRKPFFLALTGLALVGCGPGGGSGPDAGPPPPDPCQIFASDEAKPGSPFNFPQFKSDILPDLQTTCGTAGCHLAPSGQGNYNVWAATDTQCPDVQSFNAFYDRVDFRINPANSVLLKNMDGTDPHPVPYADNPLLAEFRAFIDAAYIEYTGGGVDQAGYFDETIYAQQIQPVLDSTGCLGAGCHNKTDNAGTLGLNPNPAAGSPEMAENFAKITTYVDLNTTSPDASTLYFRASDRHRGIALSADALTALRAWIQVAMDQFDPGGGPVAGCAPEAKFNVGVFNDEIMPLLEGRVDYNDIDSGRTSTGCARSECHGRDRGPGTFFIDPAAAPEQNLESFRCFVDLQNPSASDVLVCPLNLSGCPKRPHPGADIFFGVDDLNYQKMLSFIYATENGNTPLDFAFFVRKINTIYNDPNAVQDGALNLTCASSGCHRSLNGLDPDNGSNFGIIPEATDPADLFTNFIQSANFTHFPDATQSSLFLYPTNEIANVNNPLATGDPHPGGQCFAVNDQEAIDILKFAGGIRPNAQAFLQDFLVAGLFPATDVTDTPIFNEDTLEPKIFDRSGAGQQFNQGLWDGFFSANQVIDFLQAFVILNAADADDQIAYALAYVINTTTRDLETVVTVSSENDVELYVGTASALGRDGQGVSLTVVLPSFAVSKEVTRVMLKAFKQVDDVTFAFDMQFTDRNGNLLTDATKELVFVLAKGAGGI